MSDLATSTRRRLVLVAAATVSVLLAGATPAAALDAEPSDPCAAVARRLHADQTDQADRLASERLAHARTGTDRRAQADALRCLALVRRDQRRDDDAVLTLGEAGQVYLSLDAHADLGVVWRELGGLHWRNGRTAETTTAYLAAAEAFRRAGLVHDRAGALRSSTFGSGYPTADARYRARLDALALIHGTPDTRPDHRYVRGTLLHDLGDRRYSDGRYADADTLYEAAASLLGADPENRRGYSLLLTSRGRLARAQGDGNGAVEQYARAAALQRETRYEVGRGQTLNALAVALSHLGRHAEAIAALREALEVIERAGPPWRAAVARLNLATAYLDAGDAPAAVAEFERYRLDGTRAALGPGYRLGEISILRASGRPQEAIEVADRIVAATATDSRLQEVRARSLVARAQARLDLNQPSAARADLESARIAWESLRASLTPTDFVKRGFADATVAGFYALYVATLADAGAAATALEATELARARAFVDLLAQRQQQSHGPLSASADDGPAQPSLDMTDVQQLVLAEAARTDGLVMRGAAASAPSAPVASDLPDPALERARQVVPLSSTAMQQLADEEHAVIAAYWVGRDRSYVWVLQADAPLSQHTIEVGSDVLARLVAQSTEVQGAAALRRLYRLLVAPFDRALTTDRRLLIVPHGVLNRLSFATLIDERQRYLVERVSVRYVPSLTSLRQLQTNATGHRPHAPRRALVVGAPALSADAARRLPTLPGARREAAQVTAMLRARGMSTDVLTGARASKDAVRAALLTATPRLVHIAAHGVAVDGQPLRSYIALAGHGDGREHDSRLTAAEVYSLPLDAELVVLSSCRTADGPLSGDGITGLARAFLAAGTQSLVASLWDLPDDTAPQLMPAFYRAWAMTSDTADSVAPGVDKAEALRHAQRQLIARLRAGDVSVTTRFGPLALAEHPSLWGGLVLIGQR